jgi:thiol-disulfide isomerase/thioredoxin
MLGSMSVRVAAAVLALFLFALHSDAKQPFTAQAFEQAQAAGKTILIDVSATWCPTCKKQAPIIARIEKEKPNLVVYEVDFDRDKDVLKRMRVQAQSTLIVYKGTAEVARSTGETDYSRIKSLVDKGF